MTPESLLPLTAGDFHILLALAGGDLHGYAIMQEVQRLSEGSVRLGPGTLYRLLKVLLDRGLIAESGERPDPAHDDERRRYYRLTDFGQQVALAETRRLTRLVAQAHNVPGWALALAAHVPVSQLESNERRADT
jgi:DNA-binding PadR family transcriptional regulator